MPGDAVREVQAGHLLVARFRVKAYDVAVFQLRDERQAVADGGQEDVAAGFVRLGLQGNPKAVALLLDIPGCGVHAFLHAIQCCGKILGTVIFAAFAAAPPHHEGLGTQFRSKVNVPEDLAQCKAADGPVVRGEPAILEHRVAEQVGGDHRSFQAGLCQGCLEVLQDQVPLGRRGIKGNQVIVVERDAIGAKLAELVNSFHRIQGGTGGDAERIGAGPSNGPKAKGEAVLRGWAAGSFCSFAKHWGGRTGRKALQLVFNLNYMVDDGSWSMEDGKNFFESARRSRASE